MGGDVAGRIVAVEQRSFQRRGQRAGGSRDTGKGPAEVQGRLPEDPQPPEGEEPVQRGIAPPPVIAQMLVVIGGAAAVQTVVAVGSGSDSDLQPGAAPGHIATQDLFPQGIPGLPESVRIVDTVLRLGDEVIPLDPRILTVIGIKYRRVHPLRKGYCRTRSVEIAVLVRRGIGAHPRLPPDRRRGRGKAGEGKGVPQHQPLPETEGIVPDDGRHQPPASVPGERQVRRTDVHGVKIREVPLPPVALQGRAGGEMLPEFHAVPGIQRNRQSVRLLPFPFQKVSGPQGQSAREAQRPPPVLRKSPGSRSGSEGHERQDFLHRCGVEPVHQSQLPGRGHRSELPAVLQQADHHERSQQGEGLQSLPVRRTEIQRPADQFHKILRESLGIPSSVLALHLYQADYTAGQFLGLQRAAGQQQKSRPEKGGP